MSNINRFEDLEVWKEAMRLTVLVYETLKSCRDFGLKDQMQIEFPAFVSQFKVRCSKFDVLSS